MGYKIDPKIYSKRPCSDATTVYSNIAHCQHAILYGMTQRKKFQSNFAFFNLRVTSFQTVYGLSKSVDILEEVESILVDVIFLKGFETFGTCFFQSVYNGLKIYCTHFL